MTNERFVSSTKVKVRNWKLIKKKKKIDLSRSSQCLPSNTYIEDGGFPTQIEITRLLSLFKSTYESYKSL